MAIAYSSWESYFDALVKVENVLTKNRDKLAINFDHFKLKKLTVKKNFRENTLSHEAAYWGLHIFQNEEKMSAGCVLPVL